MRERPANRWILDKTWAAIDKRATLRRQGHLTTRVAHQMGRKIKSFLAADRKQRAANDASTVESHLSTSAVKEAWRALKGWYRSVEDQSPPACPEMMVKQTAKRVELYVKVPPMGVPLPFNFPYFAVSDGVPTNNEVCKVVRGLQNRQVGGATGMRPSTSRGGLTQSSTKRGQSGRILAGWGILSLDLNGGSSLS